MRSNWTLEELKTLYSLPLLQLLSEAHVVHRAHHLPHEIQICHLISVKTGGCSENCRYCAQSAHYATSVKAEPLLEEEAILQRAQEAIEQGATRICLGAAWKGVRMGSPAFSRMLLCIRKIASLGVEVCATFGMLTKEAAEALKEAGLYAYNHNLDTSESFYPNIVTTRSYADRKATLQLAEDANLELCCGGILGLGESVEDRLSLLKTLATRSPHPSSVPINQLSPIRGTPLEKQPPIPFWDLLRCIAIARITMPKSHVRLAAGRERLSYEEQALCFFAGANSLFMGEKLLTVPNASQMQDEAMFSLFGIKKQRAAPCRA